MLRQLAVFVRAVAGKPDEGLVFRLEVGLGMENLQNKLGDHAGGTQLGEDGIPEAILLVCLLDAGREYCEACRILNRSLVRMIVMDGSVHADPRPGRPIAFRMAQAVVGLEVGLQLPKNMEVQVTLSQSEHVRVVWPEPGLYLTGYGRYGRQLVVLVSQTSSSEGSKQLHPETIVVEAGIFGVIRTQRPVQRVGLKFVCVCRPVLRR